MRRIAIRGRDALAAAQKAQQPQNNEQHRPRLRKTVWGEVVEREQYAQRNQNDGTTNGAKHGITVLPCFRRGACRAGTRPPRSAAPANIAPGKRNRKYAGCSAAASLPAAPGRSRPPEPCWNVLPRSTGLSIRRPLQI